MQDERSLKNVEEALQAFSMEHAAFREPDIGNELTAIAIVPSEQARSFCRHFKLAFSSPLSSTRRASASKAECDGAVPSEGAMASRYESLQPVGASPTDATNAGVAQG